MNVALIVFAGKGERISSSVPKQFIKIDGKELVVYTIEAFNEHPLIDQIAVVTSKEYVGYVKNMIFMHRLNKVNFIFEGGIDRQASVRNGLNGLKLNNDDIVLIHDGDRPFVSTLAITHSIQGVEHNVGVAPIIKHEEALKGISNSGRFIFQDGERVDVLTPQSFYFGEIKEAHNRLKDEKFSDDVSLYEALNIKVKYISGENTNFKVTTNEDLKVAKERLAR